VKVLVEVHWLEPSCHRAWLLGHPAEPNPIGRHIQNSNRVYTIVGVIANVTKRPGIGRNAPIATEPVFYLPAAQIDQGVVNIAHVWFQPSWIVRTAR
jgi:hypothetical protein